MKISIITVCKNSELYIEESIKSVISQTYKDIEYIIIDGDSEDSTKQIVAKYSEYITHFISEPDNGLYGAMNKGIKIATGEFINFLNSDDYFYDDRVVEDVANFINEHPECCMLYGDAHIRSDSKVFTQSFISKPPSPSEIPEAIISYGSLFLQGAIFFRRDLFSKLGLFSENYKISADYEWFTRIVQDEKLKMLYYPRIVFSYYQGGISGNVTATLKEMFEIQNQVLMYQSNDWQRIRILKFQSSIIELQDFIQKIQTLSEERRILIEGIKNPFNKIFLKVFFRKLLSKSKLVLSSLRSKP
ncbi:MAG: glycosyltransferase family 2 protein [Cyanobacteria bacterium]|nr:glycosyltransferase family 2 protein [Cyanobacteriota bacterium]